MSVEKREKKEGKEEEKGRMTSGNKDAHKSTEKERILVRGTNSVGVKNETKRNGK